MKLKDSPDQLLPLVEEIEFSHSCLQKKKDKIFEIIGLDSSVNRERAAIKEAERL